MSTPIKPPRLCAYCGDLKFPGCPCETCKGQTAASDWGLRTETSKRASYVRKRKKHLLVRLHKLDSKLNFLQAQMKLIPEDIKEIDRTILWLLSKREKINEQYQSIEREIEAMVTAKHANKKPKNGKEATVENLQTLLTCIKKMA